MIRNKAKLIQMEF